MVTQNIGRRAFLGRSAALAAVAGGLEGLEAAQRRGVTPTNIIWMVADGMSAGVLPLAEQFSWQARRKGTIWQALHSRPGAAHALMDMAALDSIVTDSSSASSCWGSGSRIFNAWVNVLPDGTKLTPIGVLARDKGKRVGLVTTTTVTHATPAGFAAVSRRRDDEALFAEQYLNVCDVVLGGGSRFFDAAKRRDKRDLVADYRKAGFGIARVKSELRTPEARVLGLFADSNLPFSLDQDSDEKLKAEVPTLAEMTQAALDRLAKGAAGFLLQVEGGRVDHAAHNNDAAAMLWDQLAFDDAISVVLRFTEKNPDTLVVITTDHGNANPGLNGMGTEYRDSNSSFGRLLAARQSFATLIPQLEVRASNAAEADGQPAGWPRPSVELVRKVTSAAFGLELAAPEVEWVRSATARIPGQAMNRQFDTLVGVLGQVLSNHTGIGWTGVSHTSDYSILTALGPGSQRLEGFIRNTDVFPILCEFMDIRHRNPSMTPERAREFRTLAALGGDRPHWV
jgi:alkaline phosphatase